MRSKLVLAALLALGVLPGRAQVAPTVKISGIPLGVGGGLSDYDTDYYRPDVPHWSGRMTGASVWVDYTVFHGLGVEVEGTSIFGGNPKPSVPAGLTAYGKLKEESVQGGLIYKYRPVHKVRLFAKMIGGIAKVDFPDTDPYYTEEDAGMFTAGGGLEYPVWRTLFVRGQYEYQWWRGFRAAENLNPSGFTIGATYYLRGIHKHL